jgi:hypothetical protein
MFCIDVEPDEHTFAPDDPSPWSGFDALVADIDRLRARLAALTGEPARFVWSLRLDPQIAEAYGDPAWIIDRHRGFFDEARGQGDAVGVHPHAWRWDGADRVWTADHADPAWVDHCIETAFAAYRSRFGDAPSHHRFGGQFISERVMATADRLGAPFDLTLEPGERGAGPPGERLGGIWTGDSPDHANVPRRPYHPDPSDFRRPAPDEARGLWTIPLSSGRFVPRPRNLRVGQRLLHPVDAARLVAREISSKMDRARPMQDGDPPPPYQTLALWLDWRSLADLWDSAFASLEEIEFPYLAFAIRSDMQPRVDGAIATLSEHPQAGRLVFTTPEDALRRMGLTAEDPSSP